MNQQSALVAAFEDRQQAERAVDALEQNGFSAADVGLAIRGSDAVRGGMISDASATKDGPGAATGAITGASLGAILGAAAAFLVPGVGPIVAAGIFSMAFGGAIAGAAVGGIFGALTGLGVSEQEAKYYEQAFNAGHAIVAVRTGDRATAAAEILRSFGGYDLQTRPQSPIRTEGIFSEP
ncbi:MAG TPA: hypothetical protein VF669_18310 [Tepidisphaeraceae bacterium]